MLCAAKEGAFAPIRVVPQKNIASVPEYGAEAFFIEK